jgi:predicted ester cyclase
MAKAGETATAVATGYFDALARRALDAATAIWKRGAVDRLVGDQELTAPDGIRRYFGELFAAFPDFVFEVLDVTGSADRVAVRWRADGTFAGPGHFQGFAPNHARISIEGCDVVTVKDNLIVHNDAYVDSGDVARQLGLLPPTGSVAHRRLAQLANARTKTAAGLHAGHVEAVADGVWLIRGGFPLRTMNVYLLQEPQGGVAVFDAGIDGMAPGITAAAEPLGGIKRVVLGHADADHRGAAPALAAPVYCHEAERAAAESDQVLRSYFDLTKLRPYARPFFAKMLPTWDGGA